jgi:hypothetical protein
LLSQAKHLTKIRKEGLWDGGRNLPLPEVPPDMSDLDTRAEELCAKHGLEDRAAVKELLQRLVLADDEASGNQAEYERQQGHIVRYEDAVQLEHVITGRVITLTKNQVS